MSYGVQLHTYVDIDSVKLEMYSLLFRRWYYTCIDVLAIAKAAVPGEPSYSLTEFEVYREHYNDYWVDEFVVTNKATTERFEGDHFLWFHNFWHNRGQTLLERGEGGGTEFPDETAQNFRMTRHSISGWSSIIVEQQLQQPHMRLLNQVLIRTVSSLLLNYANLISGDTSLVDWVVIKSQQAIDLCGASVQQ